MISRGTLAVIAALSEGPGTWSELIHRCDIAESGVYENLEQLREEGVVDATPVEHDGRAAFRYELADDALDLGPAAERLLEELR